MQNFKDKYFLVAFHRMQNKMPFLWKRHDMGYTRYISEAEIYTLEKATSDVYSDLVVCKDITKLDEALKIACKTQHGKCNVFVNIDHFLAVTLSTAYKLIFQEEEKENEY